MVDNIFNVNSESRIFLIQEIQDEKYELLFGDGTLGKDVDNGNIIITDYRVVNGSLTNGANNFVAPASIGGQASFTVSVANNASIGANAESTSSIKFNAPKSFQRQNLHRKVWNEKYSNVVGYSSYI